MCTHHLRKTGVAITTTAQLYGLPWSPSKARKHNGSAPQVGHPIDWRTRAQANLGEASAAHQADALNALIWVAEAIFHPTAWEQPLRT